MKKNQIFRLLTAFIVISLFCCIKTYAQEQRVTVKFKNASLKDVFKEIEKQTTYRFSYRDAVLDNRNDITMSKKQTSVTSVLDEAFKDRDLDYKIVSSKMIAISVKKGGAAPTEGTKKVSGVVKDNSGEPVIGANIRLSGTVTGTITDIDGKFVLEVPANGKLEVTYIGYQAQEIPINNKSFFDITLKEDTQALDEVVVVGFGTQKKVNLSGSVSSINMNKLSESRPVTNLSSALAGTAAGMQVTSASNRPGNDDATILIRGVGTLNDSKPLVIIDGSEGVLSDINVNDVESISILKDAASSAIYGSRAANGVILVTTKSGKTDKMKVAYNGYVSFQTARKDILEPVSNYADYMEYINEGYTNANVTAPYSTESINAWRNDNGNNPLQYPNTNWIDETFQTGVGTNHSVSTQYGNDVIQYYGSLGYYTNPGIMENTGYERYHGMSNVTANLTKWMKLGINLSGYYGKADPADGSFGWAFATSPAMILEHNGKYGGMQDSQADISESGNNMLALLHSKRGDNITRNGKGRFFVTINPTKDLSVTGSLVYEYRNNKTKEIPVFHDFWNFATNEIIVKGKGQSYVNHIASCYQRNYTDVVAHYNHRFVDEKFGISVMAGASQEQYTSETEKYQRKDLLDLSLSVLDAANGSATATGNKSVWSMRSYFGRINLDWENKYLLEFNLRADGSSRFLKDNRWGYFPSISGAWRLSEEDFLKDTEGLDNFKIRASYGSLGNNAVGNYASRSTYAGATYIIGNAIQTGWAITSLANPYLTWEKTKVFDLGLDFALLHNRLTGTLDYFDKRTSGILIQLPIPSVHGNSKAPTSNAAEVSNKGIEVTLGWNSKVNDFSYGITANYTHINNNIDKFKGDEYSLNGYSYIKKGCSIGDMYMYEVDKIIQTDADMEIVNKMIANNPDAFKSLGVTPSKGDVLFKDINGDGIINTDDRKVCGNTNPTDYFGLNLYAGWKGIDFSLTLDGSFGYQGYINESYFSTSVSKDHQLSKYVVEKAWREGTTNAKYPRLSSQGIIATDNYNTTWMQNRDFLKIRNIQLGYTFPKSITNKISFERLRIYGSLENFFTFTNWKGIDPETDNLVYPTMRQAVIGVNVEF